MLPLVEQRQHGCIEDGDRREQDPDQGVTATVSASAASAKTESSNGTRTGVGSLRADLGAARTPHKTDGQHLWPAYLLLGLGTVNASAGLTHIGGAFGIATALLAWYVSSAETLHNAIGKAIAPLVPFGSKNLRPGCDDLNEREQSTSRVIRQQEAPPEPRGTSSRTSRGWLAASRGADLPADS
jgi:GPR1/FUN34/yaaH family